ncbi:MAG: hypothetical protein QXG00_07230 [Candidatus Woesearchaeota archaeon]
MSLIDALEPYLIEAEEAETQKQKTNILRDIAEKLGILKLIKKIPTNVKEAIDSLVNALLEMNEADINKLQKALGEMKESTMLDEGFLGQLSHNVRMALVMIPLLFLFGGSIAEAKESGSRILKHIQSEHVKKDAKKDFESLKKGITEFITKEAEAAKTKGKEGLEKLQKKVKEEAPRFKEEIYKGAEKIQKKVGEESSKVKESMPKTPVAPKGQTSNPPINI